MHTERTHTRRWMTGTIAALLLLSVACSPSDESAQRTVKVWQSKLDAQWKRLIAQAATPMGSAGNPTVPVTSPAASKPPTTSKPSTTKPSTSKPAATTTTVKRPAANAVAPSAPAPAPGNVTWSDEFDGSTLNTKVWTPYFNTYGDGNNEMACLTPNNVAVSGGTLKITARRETITCPKGDVRKFTSGFIGTRETGTYFARYGHFEMRAKLPHGFGLWPAFWLRHRNGAGTAEVDIMEYFHANNPGKTTATLHLDGRSNLSKKVVPFEQPTVSPGWHIWAVDILPDPAGVKFTFSLDGTAYHTYVDTQHKWTSADPNGTWDIAVNLAVGGNWTGDPDAPLGYLGNLKRCSQGGTPPNNCKTDGIVRADLPATYEVDYVRFTAA